MGMFKFGHKDHFLQKQENIPLDGYISPQEHSFLKSVQKTTFDNTWEHQLEEELLRPLVKLENVADNSKLLLENKILQLEQELKDKQLAFETTYIDPIIEYKEIIKEVPKEVFITVEKIVEKEKPYFITKYVDVVREVKTEVKVVEEKIIKTFHIPLWYKIALGIETLIVIALLIK